MISEARNKNLNNKGRVFNVFDILPVNSKYVEKIAIINYEESKTNEIYFQ